jgi:hypothetical protein
MLQNSITARFTAKRVVEDQLLCGCRAFLRRAFALPVHEETQLLTVLKFPFRVRTSNSNRRDLFLAVTNSLVNPISRKKEAKNGFFAGLTLAGIEFNCEKADYFRRYWRS